MIGRTSEGGSKLDVRHRRREFIALRGGGVASPLSQEQTE
jgi:hypothetical protein